MASTLTLGSEKSGRLWLDSLEQRRFSRDGVALHVRNVPVRPRSELRLRFQSVALSDREEVAAVDERGNVFVLDVRGNSYRRLGNVGSSGCSAAAFARSVEGASMLLTAVRTPRAPTLVAYDIATGVEEMRIKSAHRGRGPITSIEAHSESPLIVTTSCDAAVIWDVPALKRLRAVNKTYGSPEIIQARFVDASRVDDGARLCLLLADGMIRCYSTWTLEPAERLTLPHTLLTAKLCMPLRCIAVKPGGSRLFGGGHLDAVFEWDVANERIVAKRHALVENGGILLLQMEWHKPDEVLCLYDDGRIVAYTIEAGNVLPIYEVAPRSAAAVAFACDSDKCVVATSDGSLLYVNLNVARKSAMPLGSASLTQHRLNKGVVAIVPTTTVSQPSPAVQPPRTPTGHQDRENAPPPATQHDTTENAAAAPSWSVRDGARASKQRPRSVKRRSGRLPSKPEPVPLHRVTRLEPGKNTWLSAERLRCILAEHGEYPARYRALIWRMLLGLPEADDAYAALAAEPTENEAWSEESKSSAIAAVEATTLSDSREKNRLRRVVRALAAWCEPLGQAEWLPSAAYPFVKLFQGDEACAFEAIATLLAKFARSWLACWPEPPLPSLACVEELCLRLAPIPAKKLGMELSVEARHWAWPMMRAMFSEVLPSGAWLRLFDEVLSAGPERGGRLLGLAPVAYAATQASAIAACTSKGEILKLVRRPIGAAAAHSMLAKLKRFEALAAADFSISSTSSNLGRLADGVPSGEGRRGLASIAVDCLERGRAFPFPMIADAGSYPAMSAFPSIALGLARSERDKIALEAAQSKAARELEERTARLASEAERSARTLAATEAASEIAEEALLRQAREYDQRRHDHEREARAASLARRLRVVEQAEARTREALDAAARRRELAAQRADLSARSAQASLEAMEEEAAQVERVGELEVAAIDRVARARDALQREAQVAELAADLEHRSLRLQLESRLAAARQAAANAAQLDAKRAADERAALAQIAGDMQQSRRTADRAFFEVSLARQVSEAEADERRVLSGQIAKSDGTAVHSSTSLSDQSPTLVKPTPSADAAVALETTSTAGEERAKLAADSTFASLRLDAESLEEERDDDAQTLVGLAPVARDLHRRDSPNHSFAADALSPVPVILQHAETNASLQNQDGTVSTLRQMLRDENETTEYRQRQSLEVSSDTKPIPALRQQEEDDQKHEQHPLDLADLDALISRARDVLKQESPRMPKIDSSI